MSMASVRVPHVDDDPDIREVVEISLGLDPAFALRSCASGKDALARQPPTGRRISSCSTS
jgi:hypothetical protein